MVTLPRDSVILYATLVISFWISSEWYFLPMTALRPVTVFLMLEVICHQAQVRLRSERSARQGACCVRTPLSAASPCFRSLSVKPTMHLGGFGGSGWSHGLSSAGGRSPAGFWCAAAHAVVRLDTSFASTSMPPRRAMATTAAVQRGYQARKRGSQGLAGDVKRKQRCCGLSHRQCRNRRRCRSPTCLLAQLGTCTGQAVAVRQGPESTGQRTGRREQEARLRSSLQAGACSHQ